MTTRATGPLAGIGWLRNAVDLGRRNPRAVFGGAGLFLLVLLLLMVPMLLLQVFVQTQLDLAGWPAMALSLATTLALLVLTAAFMVGYLRLLDAAANGRAVRARDVFAGLRDAGGASRAVGFVLLLMLLQYALLLACVGLLAPEFIPAYVELLQTGAGAAVSPDAQAGAVLLENMWIVPALVIPVSLFFYAVQAVGLGQIALQGRGVFAALKDGVAGAARNAVPLLLLLVFSVIAALVVATLVALVVMLLAFVAGQVGTWLQIALLVLAVPMYVALMVGLYALMFVVMYCLWRDICGGSGEDELAAEALTA